MHFGRTIVKAFVYKKTKDHDSGAETERAIFVTTLTVTKAQLAFTFWTFNQNPFIFKMPFCRFKGDFGIDEDEEQMISGQLRQLHLIIVWFCLVLFYYLGGKTLF